MRRYLDITLYNGKDMQDFQKEVGKNIAKIQKKGYYAECHYSYSEKTYTAMILAYIEE